MAPLHHLANKKKSSRHQFFYCDNGDTHLIFEDYTSIVGSDCPMVPAKYPAVAARKVVQSLIVTFRGNWSGTEHYVPWINSRQSPFAANLHPNVIADNKLIKGRVKEGSFSH